MIIGWEGNYVFQYRETKWRRDLAYLFPFYLFFFFLFFLLSSPPFVFGFHKFSFPS